MLEWRSDKKKGKKAAVNILKARSRVLNIHITFMHVFVCVRAFMYTLGCELVVITTLYYGCEKGIHNIVHNVPRNIHLYIGSQRADYENVTCMQRCHNIELYDQIQAV